MVVARVGRGNLRKLEHPRRWQGFSASWTSPITCMSLELLQPGPNCIRNSECTATRARCYQLQFCSLNPYATVDRLGQLNLSVITNRLRISVSSVSNGYLVVAIQRISSFYHLRITMAA